MNDNMTHLEKDFLIFHRDNPRVYELFDRFTREVIKAGFTHHSARDIMRRIVWETTIVTTDDQYKINNNHTPYYARMWMRDNPKWTGFFRTRSVQEAA